MDVLFRGAQVITEKMPLEKMTAHLIVNGGVLKLAPLDFGAAGGNLVAQIEMDGRRVPIATHVDITAKGLHLEQMFPNSRLAADNSGTMGGRAKLVGNGNSVAQLLASANGEAALIMGGGSVGELTLRLANLDIANSMLLLIGGDKQTPIRCMVGNFKAVKGEFKVEDLVLDTPKVNIVGTGEVNFNDESLHLRLVAKSKGFSLASLRGPSGGASQFQDARQAQRGEPRQAGLQKRSTSGDAKLNRSMTMVVGSHHFFSTGMTRIVMGSQTTISTISLGSAAAFT